jgi:hypothetical protein
MLTADELKYAPYLKLERACHHINDLDGQLKAFLAEKPFKIIIHYRRKTGERAFGIKTEKPIPPHFSVIIGDAVHNLRSALDLTLYPMACDTADKPDRIQFPFAKDDTPKALKTAIDNGRVKFAGKKVLEAMRILNPSPTGNPVMWGIYALDNRDKHRLLILSRAVAAFTAGTGNEEAFKRFLRRDIPDGTTIVLAGSDDEDLIKFQGRFVTRDLPDNEKEAEPQPAFEITFGDGQPFAHRFVIEALVEGVHEVRSAVDALVAAFLDPANAAP